MKWIIIISEISMWPKVTGRSTAECKLGVSDN